jgi:hypothetical protein
LLYRFPAAAIIICLIYGAYILLISILFIQQLSHGKT